MFIILGQALTFVHYVMFWISRYLKSKKNILLFDSVSRIVSIMGFVLLGTYDGVISSIFIIVRNTVCRVAQDKTKRFKYVCFVLLIFVLLILHLTQYNGLSTICVIIYGILNVCGNLLCDEQGIRLFGFSGCIFYGTFLVLTQNWTGLVCEIICAIVLLNSYFVYRRKKK